MAMTLEWRGPVALVRWDDGENRVNLDSLARLNSHLDEVEGAEGPCALVLSGVGKFFSNGLDLDRFGNDPGEMGATIVELLRTVGRLFVFPAYTVAALNGHTFAGGAVISCGFDYRLMRADRGYWCMNEVDIGLPLDDKLASVLFARLPRATALHAILTGHRFTAPEALAQGIVQEVATEDELEPRAVAVAEAIAAKDRSIVAAHKRLAFADVAASLGFSPA